MSPLERAAPPSTHPEDRPRRSKLFRQLQYVAAVIAAVGPRAQPRLVWQTADGRFEQTDLPDDHSLTIGRDPAADVHGDSPRLSRRHFEIQAGVAGFELRDLGSLNGTRVNGTRVTRRTLRDGDLIEAGRQTFVYLADGHA